jgi:RimJ/RimL family protein N-acetyltransferase
MNPSASDADAAATLSALVARLRRRRWHPQAVAYALPLLARSLPDAPLAVRDDWRVALREGWPDLCRQRGERDVVFGLGVLAASLSQWRDARDCFAASLSWHGECAATHYNLAAAYWQLARHRMAALHLARATAMAPDDTRFAAGARTLAHWRAACQRRTGKDSLRDGVSGIRATLMGPHHAAALARRHADSDGQAWARLRVLRGSADAAHWIGKQYDAPGTTCIALVDPGAGLAGVLGLVQCGASALFHYWLASQFRGAGRGHAVVRLLLALAAQRGVRALYSPVHCTNAVSIAVLRQGGFRQLGRLYEQDFTGERLAYYWRPVGADSVSLNAGATGLQVLLHATGHVPAVELPAQCDEVTACW